MAYRILTEQERKWQPRKSLEGPFFYPNGRVAYLKNSRLTLDEIHKRAGEYTERGMNPDAY